MRRALWPGDDPTWERWFGNYSPPVAAKIDVDEHTAYNFSVFWCGVQMIAGTLASLPLPTYQRVAKGGRKPASDYPLYQLLHTQPNPFMTSYSFRETLQAHVLTWGNGYALIQRASAGGMPTAIMPLDPARMAVKWDKNTQALYYEYSPHEGAVIPYGPDEIFHVRGLGFNGVIGYSLVQMARESLGVGLAMEKYQASFYGNAGVPSGGIKIPGDLSQKGREALRRTLTEEHVDWKNKRRPMILEGGTEWQTFSVPQEDAQFLESRRFSVEEFARWFKLPVHLLREMTNSSVRANIEQESLEFVLYTMRDWAVRWEQEIVRQLIPLADRETYFAEFNFDGLLRGDSATRADIYMKGVQTGRYTINEILQLENVNPIGPEGDYRFVPMNLTRLQEEEEEPDEPDDKEPEEEPEEEPEKEPDEEQEPDEEPEEDEGRSLRSKSANTLDQRLRVASSYERLFVDAAGRTVRKEVKAGRQAVKKHLPLGKIEALGTWFTDFYDRQIGETQRGIGPVVAALLESLYDVLARHFNGSEQMPEPLFAFVHDYALGAGRRHASNSLNQLNALLRDTPPLELQEALDRRLKDWGERRAERAGTLEWNQAVNALSLEIFRGLGVRNKRWVFRCSPGNPCESLGKRIVLVDELFVHKGEDLPMASKTYIVMRDRLHPPLRDGCICQIEAEL